MHVCKHAKVGKSQGMPPPRKFFSKVCKLNPTEVMDGQFEKGLVLPNLGKAHPPTATNLAKIMVARINTLPAFPLALDNVYHVLFPPTSATKQ